jgi:hypothetical protein
VADEVRIDRSGMGLWVGVFTDREGVVDGVEGTYHVLIWSWAAAMDAEPGPIPGEAANILVRELVRLHDWVTPSS